MQRYFSISDNEIILSSSDVHHIVNVMRSKKGDLFEIVSNSIIYVCEIVSINPLEYKIVESKQSLSELNKDITLFYCLAKGDKNELVIQKATEIGVKNIVFLSSKRSVVKLDQKDFLKKKERYIKIAKEASEQSKRTTIPNIYGLFDINKIPNELLSEINTVAYEESSGFTSNTYSIFTDFIQNNKSLSILIGPEGGLDINEIDELKKQGFKLISLGKRILRTETAAIYALSVMSFLL
jgi:16S rRNA (uracil1498-N3)-methyltransferase